MSIALIKDIDSVSDVYCDVMILY